MGSYNWTRNAARNSEDLNLVASRALAAIYAAQWRSRVGCLGAVCRARGLVPATPRNPLDGGN